MNYILFHIPHSSLKIPKQYWDICIKEKNYIKITNTFLSDYLTDKALYVSTEKDNNLNKALRAIKDRVDEILTENKTIKDKDEILDVYFKILDFLRIADLYSTTHRLLGKVIDDAISILKNAQSIRKSKYFVQKSKREAM